MLDFILSTHEYFGFKFKSLTVLIKIISTCTNFRKESDFKNKVHLTMSRPWYVVYIVKIKLCTVLAFVVGIQFWFLPSLIFHGSIFEVLTLVSIQ